MVCVFPSAARVVCATAAALTGASFSSAHWTFSMVPLAVTDCGQAGGSSTVTSVQSQRPVAAVLIARSRQSVG